MIRNRISFALLCFVALIGPKKLVPLSQPIRCKTKANRNLVTRVSRALGSLLGLTLTSPWLLRVFFFLLIGCGDNFGFGFTRLNRKTLCAQFFDQYMFHIVASLVQAKHCFPSQYFLKISKRNYLSKL